MLFSFGPIQSDNVKSDFTLKINKSKIKTNKYIVMQSSQILAKYIKEHPTALGCSFQIAQLSSDEGLSTNSITLIQKLFNGEVITINQDNINVLYHISKNLKMPILFDKVSSYQIGNFNDEIEIEKLLLSLTTTNLNEIMEKLGTFNEFKVVHILLGICIMKLRKPKSVKIYIELIQKIDPKIQTSFRNLLFNHLIHPKSPVESEAAFLLRQLFDCNLIDHLLIQTLPKLPLNFSDVISNSKLAIEKDRLQQYSKNGFNPDIIASSIRIDDLETFEQVTMHHFDFDSTLRIEKSPFESCEYVNKGCYLIEYAAFFGSLICFKYLAEKYTLLPFNIAKFAIAGGKKEIISICEEKHCNFDDTLTPAIIYRRQGLIEWLVNEKNQTVSLSHLNDCIEYGNFTALKYFIQVLNKSIYDLTIAAKYNLFELIHTIDSYRSVIRLQNRYNNNSFEDDNNSSSSPSNNSANTSTIDQHSANIRNKKVLIQIACLYGNYEVFELYCPRKHNKKSSLNKTMPTLRKGHIDTADFHRYYQMIDESIFYSACKGNNFRILKRIVDDYQSIIGNLNIINVKGEMFNFTSVLSKCLFKAVSHSNDIEFVRFIFDVLNKRKIVDLNAKSEKKSETLLFIAARKGNYRIVDFLLEKGATIDSINGQYESTPLYIACLNGKVETVKRLLANKTKPQMNLRTKGTLQTPLHAACEFGNFEIVEMLLETGNVDTIIYDKRNMAPIHIAIMNNSVDIVLLLFDKSSAAINVRSYYVSNDSSDLPTSSLKLPIEIAVENGSVEMVSILLGLSPSGTSLFNNHISSDSLIKSPKQKFMVSKPTSIITPEVLFSAVRSNNSQIVSIILQHKNIYINHRSTKFGLTPLSQAVLNVNLDMMKILLKQNLIDVNSKNDNGTTALHFACKGGDLLLVDYLLQQEFIDVNLRDIEGKTPLHYACQSGKIDVVKALLDFPDIDPEKADNSGQTPDELAVSREIRNLFHVF